MRHFSLLTLLFTMVISIAGTQAYLLPNCKGSILTAKKEDCQKAIANVDADATYTGGSEFSYGTCFLIYRARKGEGNHRTTGHIILNAIDWLYKNCHRGGAARGSVGTGDCRSCYVTINYREAFKESREVEAVEPRDNLSNTSVAQ